MTRDNNFKKNKELNAAKREAEKRNAAKKNKGTKQEQLGNQKFQDIADQRYQRKMEDLYSVKFNAESEMEKAARKRKALDVQRQMLLFKNNRFSFDNFLKSANESQRFLQMKIKMLFYRKWH